MRGTQDKLEARLKELYYAVGGFQGAQALYDEVKGDPRFQDFATTGDVKRWLDKQPINQIHSKYHHLARKIYPHFNIETPNDTHQADLLFIIPNGKFKYILTLVDCASRYRAAVAITSKSATTVAKGLASIYTRKGTPLKYPRVLMVDQGGEFQGATSRLMKAHGVNIMRSDKFKHRAQAFVEAFNKSLAKRLFKAMDYRGDNTWFKDLQPTVTQMNSEVTALTGLKPAEAIKMQKVEQPQMEEWKIALADKKLHDVGDHVRYLLAPDETIDGNRRATDAVWSEDVYVISGLIKFPNSPRLYYIKGPITEEMSNTEADQQPQKQHTFTGLQLKQATF